MNPNGVLLTSFRSGNSTDIRLMPGDDILIGEITNKFRIYKPTEEDRNRVR